MPWCQLPWSGGPHVGWRQSLTSWVVSQRPPDCSSSPDHTELPCHVQHHKSCQSWLLVKTKVKMKEKIWWKTQFHIIVSVLREKSDLSDKICKIFFTPEYVHKIDESVVVSPSSTDSQILNTFHNRLNIICYITKREGLLKRVNSKWKSWYLLTI